MSVESKKVIFNQSLLDFLNRSPTPFHAVQTMSERLEQASFLRLDEKKHWNLKPGQGYYTVRNGSSIIAWRQPTNDAQFAKGLRFVGAHTDSPCLKVKPQPELLRQGYFQLGVEVYGGVLLNPWFDRDLSIAGRVTARNLQGHLVSHLINFNKPLAIIPSLAIHLDREANSARSINAQTFLPPIIGQHENEHDFREIVKQHLVEQGVDDLDAVLDYELCFYDCQKAALVGLNHEFICSARLDNLLSCFIGLQALLTSDTGLGQVLICNDHEEVGSASACGAQGPMLNQWLDRILPAGNRYEVLANSLFVSADNAHGVHPNFADRHDENHGPLLNKGPVIKINANQRYASNSETSAIFRHLADQVGVPVQCFVVRSDQGCGSTIGPIVATETGIPTVDVGVPQFAMHSIRETAGSEDALGLARILQRFYQTENLLV